MAGLGETCTHVSALLFYAEAVVKVRFIKTPTEAPAYWKIPSSLLGDDLSTAEDIDFVSPKKKISNFNKNVEPSIFSAVPDKRKKRVHPFLVCHL